MKLSKILYVLLGIAVILFAVLSGLTFWMPTVKPAAGTLLYTYVDDIQTGLKWLLGVGTAITGGTHFISYVWSQFQAQQNSPQPQPQQETPK